jgi:hypothetical protein
VDAISIIIGGMLGGLAGWAFSIATSKRRAAVERLDKATRAKEKEGRLKVEAKGYRERSLAETIQGFLFYALGISIIVVMGLILFSSFG